MANHYKILHGALLVCLLSLPFFAYRHAAPLASFYNEWFAGVFAIGMLPVFFRRASGTRIHIPLTSLVFLLLILLVALQMAFGEVLYPSQGRLAILYLLCAFVLAMATRELAARYGQSAIVAVGAWTFLAVGVTSSLLAVLQYWEIHTWLDDFITAGSTGRAYANLGQSNHFADLLVLSMAALLYLSAKRQMPAYVAGALAALIMLGLALAFSRTTWLYLVGLVFCASMLRLRENTEISRRLLAQSLLLVPLFVGMLVALGLSTESAQPLAPSAARMTSFEGSSIDIRLAFLREAWRTFLEAPLLGVGYQQFSWHHFLHQSAQFDPVFVGHEHLFAANAHNLLFQFLAEFGVVGGLLLLGAVLWLIRCGLRNFSADNWPVYAMLLTLAIHSQFEYPLYYMYFLALAAVLLALADDRIIWTVPRRLAVLPAAFTILLGGVILATMLRSYGHLEEAYGGTSGQIVFKSSTENALVQASVGGFFEPEIDQLINIMPINLERDGASRILLETSQRAVRHRTSAPRVYRHVLLLALEGHDAEADEFLGRAARAYPRSLSEFSRDVDRLRLEYPDIQAFAELQAKVQVHLSASEGRST
jgi:O-antigen ligase